MSFEGLKILQCIKDGNDISIFIFFSATFLDIFNHLKRKKIHQHSIFSTIIITMKSEGYYCLVTKFKKLRDVLLTIILMLIMELTKIYSMELELFKIELQATKPARKLQNSACYIARSTD